MRAGQIIKDGLQAAIDNRDSEKVLCFIKNDVYNLIHENKLSLIRALQYAGIDVDAGIDSDDLKVIAEREIDNGNEVVTEKILYAILSENVEWHEGLAGWIIEGIGALVKGVGDSVAAKFNAQAKLTVLKNKAIAEGYNVQKADVDIVTTSMNDKAKANKTLGAEEIQGTKVVSASQNLVKVSLVVCGLFLCGLITTVFVLKNKEVKDA